VQRAVRRALLAHTPVPGLDASTLPRWGSASECLDLAEESLSDELLPEVGHPADGSVSATGEEPFQGANPPPGSPVSSSFTPAAQALPVRSLGILRLIGQIAGTYLVAEGPDGLYLIDQHAAHERVLYERLMAQRSESVPSQSLLRPVTVDLPPASARLIADQLPVLGSLGFQVEPFGSGNRGESAFLVRAIPAVLTGSDPAAALRVLVEDFEEDETPLQNEIEARIIARVCKRAAVKAGHTLSPEEQRALLADLEACHSPRTCPHGRPTMIHISVDLLERQFGRKGAR
jgi:DNA mismatch repair protein MutL